MESVWRYDMTGRSSAVAVAVVVALFTCSIRRGVAFMKVT